MNACLSSMLVFPWRKQIWICVWRKNKLYKPDNSQIHLFTLATGALVSGHQHEWCCVQTLGIPGTQVPSLGVMIRPWVFQVPKYHLVPEYKVETTLYPGVDAVPEFWCKYSQKGVFTLMLSQNRALGACIGTKPVNMPKNITQILLCPCRIWV